MFMLRKVVKMEDQIVYLVNVAAGGQDGRDPTQEGGVALATFSHDEAVKRVGVDARLSIEKKIVEDSDTKAALAKLTKLDFLLVQQYINRQYSEAMQRVGRI